MSTLTTVVNTLNSAATLESSLKSVRDLGEIIVVDMHSDDNTLEIAKQFTTQIFLHDRTGFVEPARNYAISKATTDWILVLDSDEEISDTLKKKIREIIKSESNSTHVYFPRKNMIFGSWMQHTGWWPDEKMRLFKKGTVTWKNEIHSEPECQGESHHLAADEKLAIIHHHYNTVSDWVLRMDRYTTIQAKEISNSKYKFDWRDLIRKPLSEFLTRFFVWEGWKDGANGFALSVMQALSWVIVYMKVKELRKISNRKGDQEFLREVGEELDTMENEIGHYLEKLGLQSQLKRWIQKVLP